MHLAKSFLATLFLVSTYFCAFSTTHSIGQGQAYPTPNALYASNIVSTGDTIHIYPQDYIGADALAVWMVDDLVIQGIGTKPHLIADGQYIWGKGIWVLFGNNITVENLEFSGATVPDQNGAGIRLDGVGMTIRDCYFHDNENGILTGSGGGNILIEYSEFAYNGFGDGQSHNLYVNNVDRLTFRYNYSHHAKIGHNLKTRAAENIISYNRIMDENTGNSSRLIDLSNGGLTTIIGNLLMQGPNAENNNLIGYGLEGLTKPVNELYVYHNSMVNKRVASCIFVQIQAGTSKAEVVNNIFGGTGIAIDGQTSTVGQNYISQNIPAIGFAAESSYDYSLTFGSPAVDFGTSAITTLPSSIYIHPTHNDSRTISNYIIDAGAYELDQGVDNLSPIKAEITVESGDILVEDADYGIVLKSADGKCFRLVVSSSGQLSTVNIDCQ